MKTNTDMTPAKPQGALDPRIGILCREGETIYYATLQGRHAESRHLADVEFHLEVADRANLRRVQS